MVRVAAICATALATAALLLGCDGDEPQRATTPAETAERASLPAGWQRLANFDAGITLGAPPGWQVRRRGTRTTLRSPDRLVAVTLSADRTRDAIATGAEEFARRVAASLPYRSARIGRPRSFAHAYPAVAIALTGRTRSGLGQAGLVVVLERRQIVKITALVAANQSKASGRDLETARRILRTVRSRPVV